LALEDFRCDSQRPHKERPGDFGEVEGIGVTGGIELPPVVCFDFFLAGDPVTDRLGLPCPYKVGDVLDNTGKAPTFCLAVAEQRRRFPFGSGLVASESIVAEAEEAKVQ